MVQIQFIKSFIRIHISVHHHDHVTFQMLIYITEQCCHGILHIWHKNNPITLGHMFSFHLSNKNRILVEDVNISNQWVIKSILNTSHKFRHSELPLMKGKINKSFQAPGVSVRDWFKYLNFVVHLKKKHVSKFTVQARRGCSNHKCRVAKFVSKSQENKEKWAKMVGVALKICLSRHTSVLARSF